MEVCLHLPTRLSTRYWSWSSIVTFCDLCFDSMQRLTVSAATCSLLLLWKTLLTWKLLRCPSLQLIMAQKCVCVCVFWCACVGGSAQPSERRALFPYGLVRKEFLLVNDAYTTTSSCALWEETSDLCGYDYFLLRECWKSESVRACMYVCVCVGDEAWGYIRYTHAFTHTHRHSTYTHVHTPVAISGMVAIKRNKLFISTLCTCVNIGLLDSLLTYHHEGYSSPLCRSLLLFYCIVLPCNCLFINM